MQVLRRAFRLLPRALKLGRLWGGKRTLGTAYTNGFKMVFPDIKKCVISLLSMALHSYPPICT